MGLLAKTLAPVSAYAAKKTPLWDELTDRIAGAILPQQLDDVEQWMFDRELELPGAWQEPLADLIEKRREEIADEDINNIVRSRFDF